MGIKTAFMHGGGKLVLELPGRRRSLEEWADKLIGSAIQIELRAGAATDEEKTQKILRHISGLEHWGQRRLRVFLGESTVMDDYDDYRPRPDLSTAEQQAFFRNTRAKTVVLAYELADTQIDPKMKVAHNEFGPLSPRGWLRHLDLHANTEIKKVK